MRDFNYCKLKDNLWSNDILNYCAIIHEYKGKQEYFIRQKPQELERLVEIAKVQSTEASNEIEGIRTSSTRLKQICKDKTTPRNRAEEGIAGYRDVLNVVHENFDYIQITPNYILQMHKIMYGHQSSNIGGKFKSVQNYINATDERGNSRTIFTPLAPYETAEAMAMICAEFNRAVAENAVDPLILIPIFIHDFLCIHPFIDGNGRMSRLLTTLLLYKCGYSIGKYISLESKIPKHKDLYYDALAQSQYGWNENKDNPEAFIKYLLGTIISAYRDFEERFNILNGGIEDGKAKSVDMVKRAIDSIIGKFNKAKIMELCPSLSVSTIESALRKLVAQKEIEKQGIGKSTFYIRIK